MILKESNCKCSLTYFLPHCRCHKRRVVLRKGHIGYNLYFIFCGEVSVILDKDDDNIFVKTDKVILRRGACFGVWVLELISSLVMYSVSSLYQLESLECSHETLVSDENSFLWIQEIALMQNTRRNATVICHEECEFLVIEKQDFLSHGLHKQMQQEFERRYAFFR